MHLEYFPFDRQICPLLIETYSHRASEMTIYWHEDEISKAIQGLTPFFRSVQHSITFFWKLLEKMTNFFNDLKIIRKN